jgi:hypothetical protein
MVMEDESDDASNVSNAKHQEKPLLFSVKRRLSHTKTIDFGAGFPNPKGGY